jgi:DHA2 family multidrug resistance protein-like MFS transporter
MAQNVGWRSIFFASAAISALGMLMVRGTPESKATVQGNYVFDTKGVMTFMVTMVALQVLTTQGSQMGWTNPITLGLAAVAAIFAVVFFKTESAARFPFVNFGLFRNATFERLLTDALAKRPGTDRDQLLDALRDRYRAFVKSRRKPPTVPPKA